MASFGAKTKQRILFFLINSYFDKYQLYTPRKFEEVCKNIVSTGVANDWNNSKKLPQFAPIDLIDLTVKRLVIKKEKRFELMKSIKEIQKETNAKVEQLLGNE